MPRYITVEDALNEMCDNCDSVRAVCPHYPCKRYTSVERIHSADVAEVKHGKWEKMWHSYFKQELPCCSVCGHFSAMRWKYCPNCGADMRGGTDG